MWKIFLALLVSVLSVSGSVTEMVCGGLVFENPIVCSTSRHVSWCCERKTQCGVRNGTCLVAKNLRGNKNEN